jgi:hypothetical protein
VSHAVLLMIPGVVVAAVNRLEPKPVKDSINIQTWMALGTKANDEVISSDNY